MSIIDKKGKLFGKLNIIDLIVILLILAVIVLLGYKLTGNRDNDLAGGGQPVSYTVRIPHVQPEVYEFVKNHIPSPLVASDEILDLYVKSVQAKKTEDNHYELREDITSSATGVYHSSPGTYDLVFTIEGNAIKNEINSKVGSQEISVGRPYLVKTKDFELGGGVILSCEHPAEPVDLPNEE